MTRQELLDLLQRFHREKLALRMAHERHARAVRSYEFNNAYQYVIAREDQQLGWLREAIETLGGMPEAAQEDGGGPSGSETAHLEHDVAAAASFLESWRPLVETLPHARHKGMLRVILGETVEHQRLFEQALAGRRDLLGRRPDGAGTGGGVLPSRWVE